MKKRIRLLVSAFLVLVLALGSIQPIAANNSIKASETKISTLRGMSIPASAISLPTHGAKITSVELVKETHEGNNLGEYVKVLGAILPVEPEAPEIRFQVNLPTNWNGKALQMGGGGYNGTIPDTLREPTLGLKTIPVPLAQGYITFASDSGHQARDGNDASFALNDEALLNYGYMHIKKTRDVAYVIAENYYGEAPRRLYFSGGSTGGREGLTAAMRWPEAYDGIITNYPSAYFMGLRLWGAQLANAIYDNNSAGWISPEVVQQIQKMALEQLDELDGIKDGVVSNIEEARAQSSKILEEITAEHGLTTAQLDTLKVYHDGYSLPYSLANGITSYPGYNSLEGIAMQIGSQPEPLSPIKSGPNAHHADRADQFFKYFVAQDPDFDLLSIDIKNPGKYKERIIELSNMIDATNPDLTKFQEKGGKILWVHGWHDASISPFSSINLYQSIVDKMGQSAVDRFIRLYMVPGLAHGGGSFSVTWDNLNILDNWVENNVPPPVTPGVDINKDTFGRSLPMYAYPGWPMYTGTGDANDWLNYTQAPKTDSTYPTEEWSYFESPEAAGYSSVDLQKVTDKLKTMPTTSLMVVKGGKVLYSYGDTSEVSYLASARKSVLSLLYGRYVENGTINPDSTLGELGIDDVESLLPLEKTARVRDLLKSSSGVYHPQGSPGGDTSGIPERGSKRPGEFFLYNNWDFNVAGAIFEKATKKTIFEALEKDLATPLQFQDFDPKRQRMLGFESVSNYKAYHMFLSARDLARLGLLVLNDGRWNDQQIVPKEWLDESLKVHVQNEEIKDSFGKGVSYGYLWWLPEAKSPEWEGAFLANGNYGQFILGLPALDMVIVHRRAVTDEFAINRNLGKDSSNPPGVTVDQFLNLADMIIAARKK